jgi:hypothetical protein
MDESRKHLDFRRATCQFSSSMNNSLTRRSFVPALAAATLALVIPQRKLFAAAPASHPTPRPGITGHDVLTRKELAKTPEFIPLFDGIREIPQIADGIGCNCGCTDAPERRSLLSCYEAEGMARECIVCQGQARLAIKLQKEGKTLDEIRAAIDARFG